MDDKYIVYLTINTVNKKIYVGVHKTKTPYKFDGYLGCGVKVNDRYSQKRNKTPFQQAVNKYGVDKFKRTTLYVYDTLNEALNKEAEIVNYDFILRKDTYNIALGGGFPLAQVKLIYQYDIEGNFLRKWNSITEASIYYNVDNCSIGRAVLDKTPSIGFLWTDYYIEKLNINNFRIGLNKKIVYVYDINGNYLNEYPSIRECSKILDLSPKDVSTSIKGFYSIKDKYYISFTKYDKYPIDKFKDLMSSKIYQYSIYGEYIKEYSNSDEILKEFGTLKNFSISVRLQRPFQNYLWSLEKYDKIKPYKNHNFGRKVGKYDLEGNLVTVFNSVVEAKKDTCGAPNVLRGLRKTAGGHIFKYLE